MRITRIIILLLFIFSVLTGCKTAGLHVIDSLFPVPVPATDEPFRTTQGYNAEFGQDIRNAKHSMADEKQSEVDAANLCSKLTSKITINGRSTPCKPRTKIFDNAKKIGDNDYIIGCSKVPQPEKQKNQNYCWVAGAQFIIAATFKIHVEQDAIFVKIKKEKAGSPQEQAGTIMDAMTAMGFGGISLFSDGSRIILESLASKHPVMVGISGADAEQGHIIVIVAARFSFPRAAKPFCLNCTHFSFTELTVYDPWTGEITQWDANDIKGRMDFILAYNS